MYHCMKLFRIVESQLNNVNELERPQTQWVAYDTSDHE